LEVCLFHLEVCPLRTDVLVATMNIYPIVYTMSMKAYSEIEQEFYNQYWSDNRLGDGSVSQDKRNFEKYEKLRQRLALWSGYGIEDDELVNAEGKPFSRSSKSRSLSDRMGSYSASKELQELYDAIEEIRKEFGLHGFYNPMVDRISDRRKKTHGVLQFSFTLAPHTGDPRKSLDMFGRLKQTESRVVSVYEKADDLVFTKSKSEFLAIAREVYEQVSSDNRNWDKRVEEFLAELDEEIRIQDIAEKKLLDDFGKFGVKMVGREIGSYDGASDCDKYWHGILTDNARNFEGELENGLKVIGTLEHGKVSSLNVETKPEDSAKLLELISHVGKGLDSIQG